MPDALLDELIDWLRIPSVSTAAGDPAALRAAGEWVCARVREAGGEAGLVETAGHPLAVGELRARRPDAPTVLVYGHYDVQSPEPLEAWTAPPFQPEVRDGRLYARGASDDKGNFLPLLHVACALARAGELPVHVRVLVEGEEEVGGETALHWVAADPRGADCAIVFDSDMVDARTPALTLGVRGLAGAAVEVRTAPRDLHSGLYGGTVLNAVHALHAMLGAVVPGPDGRVRPELAEGVAAVSEAERASWAALPSGADVLAEVGGRPVSPGADADFYERTGAAPAVDVNWVEAGQRRTIVPAVARAQLTLRLAPGQSSARMREVLAGLLRDAAPPGAEVDVQTFGADPALFDPEAPALRLAADALTEACGVPCALVRSGGSIPVLSAFAARGIPCALSGFALADDAVHAPDESFRLESLRLGERAARELYAALGRLAT